MKFSWDRFDQLPLIAILRGYDVETSCKVVDACVGAGFTTLEITLNSPDALESVQRLSKAHQNSNIGVGTVCYSEQVYESHQAGASFVVTPAVALDVIAACKELGLPVFCGAMTPSECLTAVKAGADAVKLFPASVFGPSYLSAIRGPLDSIRFVPTGGVTPENIPEYIRAGAKGFGIGGSLFPKEAIGAENFPAVAQQAAKFISSYRQATSV